MTPDPLLINDLVREAIARYGTGFKHGDGPILYRETWEDIMRFVLQYLEDNEALS